MSNLIITLPNGLPTTTASCAAVLGDDMGAVIRHVVAPLALLPEAGESEVVVVVPAEQLSWHRVELPKGTLDRGLFQDGSTARLRTVLDGLLEDRLLDEPENLHLAIQPQPRAGEPVWVAACDRAWLRAWLQALEQSARPVARIVPALEPVASGTTDAHTLHAVGTPEQAHLIWASLQGVSVLPLNAASAALLANARGDVAQSDVVPGEIVAEPGVAALTEHLLPGRISLQTAAQRAMAAARSGWDLAQFDLLSTRQARTRKQLSSLGISLWRAPHWRPARWAALALVVVNLVGLQAWAWKEQSALQAKRDAIRAVLLSTFPDVRVVVDAPQQMARALADLQRQSGAASSLDLETMLGLFQTLALEESTPSAIEFIAGELRLKTQPISDAQLASLSTRLQAQGYAAQMRGDSLVISVERRP